jgi:hypothetical protein
MAIFGDAMPIEEEWKDIPEFPGYAVSSFGRIWNKYRNREVAVNQTNWGHVKVCFTDRRLTRSVAVLVAEAFVEPPDELSDCVVLLDGNLNNIRADNIVWRPRQYAWRYARQVRTQQPLHYRNLPVVNLDLHVEYDSIIQAGMTEGVLFDDIWESTFMGRRPYPYHHKYRILERV